MLVVSTILVYIFEAFLGPQAGGNKDNVVSVANVAARTKAPQFPTITRAAFAFKIQAKFN